MNPPRYPHIAAPAVRKVVYLCFAAALLIPIVLLSRPATPNSTGGKLATLRAEQGLGSAYFGEIDTTGETVRVASLGMQGFASMALWQQANEQKKKEDWWGFEATLHKITKISPNFIHIWKYQAHNLSFNLSAEFDDYRQRYEWVKKGIALLNEGRRLNEHDPRLSYDLGWFICQKIGKSDERELFRRMYLEEEKRDNWLVGKDWYLAAQQIVDTTPAERLPPLGMSRSVFHAQPAMAQIYYGLALEEDGFDWDELNRLPARARATSIDQTLERWKQAWRGSQEDWYLSERSMGNRAFAIGQAFTVRMNEQPRYEQRLGEVATKLYQLAPDAADRLLLAQKEGLYDAEAAALQLPRAKRTAAQQRMLIFAMPRLSLSHNVAAAVPPARRSEATQLADECKLEDFKFAFIERLQTPIRFDGWKLRSIAEVEPESLQAFRAFSEAKHADYRGRLAVAKSLYEEAFRDWAALLKKHPKMMDEVVTSNDIMQYIMDYETLVVHRMEEPFPKEFALQSVLDEYLSGHPMEYRFRKETGRLASPAVKKP
jgi:hypothetical protein